MEVGGWQSHAPHMIKLASSKDDGFQKSFHTAGKQKNQNGETLMCVHRSGRRDFER